MTNTEAFLHGQRQVLELMASGAPVVESLDALLRVVEREAPAMRCAVYEEAEEEIFLRLVAAPGLPSSLVEATDEIVVGPSSGVTGAAVYRREPVHAADIATDPLWDDSRSYILPHGIRAAWAVPLRSAAGRVIGALTCYLDEARDPTRQEMELAGAAVHLASIALSTARDAASLRRSEASFRSFVENAPAAIFRETRRGHLVSSNPAMVSLLGYRNAEALVQAAEEGLLYRDARTRAGLLASLERNDVVRGEELELRRADGTFVCVRLSARSYRDDRGEVWLWEGYAEDVTLLRDTERALRHNEKLAAVGQLISGVAHELNNPLSSIMHFAEDLMADARSMEDAEALIVIRDQARRSRTIVRDLLSFVQQREAHAERLVLADVVTATTRVLRPAFEKRGVRLQVCAPDDASGVLADRSGLEQVVTNLVNNALQAAGPGGAVWVRTETAGARCRLFVEDDGPGIAPDVLPRIFDPFFTTKGTGEGTGLGLSVSLGIVEQLGGRISVEPRGDGLRGTRFVVTLATLADGAALPRPEARRASAVPQPSGRSLAGPVAPPPKARPVHAGSPVALVIDDEPTIRAALRRYFTRRGWQVEEAEDGAAALSLLEAHGERFTVIVSDLRMPGLSGMELHDRLESGRPELLSRIVFSTGDVASRDAASFLQRTRCAVLQKPFELRMLDDTIARLRGGAEAEPVVS